MAVMSSSGLTSVTGSVSASITQNIGVPSASQTLVFDRFALNGGNQTLRAVTAGKTFYLFGFSSGATTGGPGSFNTSADTSLIDFAANERISSSCPICSWAGGTNARVSGTNGKYISYWGIEQ